MRAPIGKNNTAKFDCDKLNSLYVASRRVTRGCPVDLYLQRQGIDTDDAPDVLRCHDSVPYEYQVIENSVFQKKTLGAFPAMLAVVHSACGHHVGIHRTYLSSSGHIADVEQPRKIIHSSVPVEGGAIRLFAPEGGALVIAESVEKAMSVHAHTGLPVWAALSNRLMESVAIPHDVAKVYICAENDRTDEKGNRVGRESAIILRNRLLAEGRKVEMYTPYCSGINCFDLFEGKIAA